MGWTRKKFRKEARKETELYYLRPEFRYVKGGPIQVRKGVDLIASAIMPFVRSHEIVPQSLETGRSLDVRDFQYPSPLWTAFKDGMNNPERVSLDNIDLRVEFQNRKLLTRSFSRVAVYPDEAFRDRPALLVTLVGEAPEKSVAAVMNGIRAFSVCWQDQRIKLVHGVRGPDGRVREVVTVPPAPRYV